MQQRKLQREQNQQKEKIDFEMKNQNQINDTNKSEEIIKDIADFETLLEMNRNDKNSPEVSILRVAAFWSGTFSRQIIYI